MSNFWAELIRMLATFLFRKGKARIKSELESLDSSGDKGGSSGPQK